MLTRRKLMGALGGTVALSRVLRPPAAHATTNRLPANVSSQSPRPLQEALRRFLGYRYGAFIHWGPATVSGKEISWSRQVQTPQKEYDTLYQKFNPAGFDAEAWVKTLQKGGFHYMIYVTKHHEGFAMWDTKTTDHNIMHSPFGRDVVREISLACRKLNFPLCFYYSIADFYHPDCIGAADSFGTNYGAPGYPLPPGQRPDFDRYVTYMKAQLRELTESYGPVVGWWFDGGWQKQWTYERGRDLYDYVRRLQPDVLMDHRVGGAHNGKVYLPTWFPQDDGRVGDYAVLEVDMPRFNRDVPWEYTTPANERSYSWTPGPYGDPNKWLDNLIRSACGDGNYVLGVSAPPSGRFQPELTGRLEQAGVWLQRYGQSVYGTRGGVYKRTTLYGSTCRGNLIYLHVFGATVSHLVLPPLPKKIVAASMLNGGEVKVAQTERDVTVDISPYDLQIPSTIIVLELDGSAEEIAPIGELPVNRNVRVKSSNADPSRDTMACDGNPATFWQGDGKTQPPWLEYDLGRERSISRAVLFEGRYEGELARIQKFQIQARSGDEDWKGVVNVNGWGGESDTAAFDEWPISVSHPEVRFAPVQARHVRLKLLRTVDLPIIHEFELYER